MPGPAYNNCTEVTDFCTVEETTYGYRPSLGGNILFLIIFASLMVVTLYQGIRHRSIWYNIWIALGCAGELAGYGGRVAMHYNPWNDGAFTDQIAALIFSPSFLAAACYLTLKHMVRAVGIEYSPMPASAYAWLFIICDFISLLLQAAGGGVAAGANDDKTSDAGGHIMLAGIIFQVITLTFLYGLFLWIVRKVYQDRANLKPAVREMLHSRDFRIFAYSILLATTAIYIRCVYRIAELAGGWANHIMRSEAEYMILDSTMCAIAAMALCFAHPAYWFKCMLTQEYPATRDGHLSEKLGSSGGAGETPGSVTPQQYQGHTHV